MRHQSPHLPAPTITGRNFINVDQETTEAFFDNEIRLVAKKSLHACTGLNTIWPCCRALWRRDDY
jgi:hypothetical protein